jgi:hypothetical protein
MTPQGNFQVMAKVALGREEELRGLLEAMNSEPGVVDPENALLPFGRFDTLHFARILVLSDPTEADITAYGVEVPRLAPTLAFFGECDGEGAAFLAELAAAAEEGLAKLFACCEGFGPNLDPLGFMKTHSREPAAAYVNTIGRTVRQIREEAALYRALSDHLSAPELALGASDPRALWRELMSYAGAQHKAGALALSPPEPTPLGWRLADLADLVGGSLLALVLLPFALVLSPLYLWVLRRHETLDPEITPRPDPAARAEIAKREDHDVSNAYLVVGCLKPGRFRLWTSIALLAVVKWGARHIYNRGHLGRVQTIHFARWVFVNERRQMFFTSCYDGSQEAYMDDFINKVGWGLNLLFSNGVGYPVTNWLILDGAANEQKFEYYIFRHQLPIQVWYKAYPGLTAFDLKRNTMIRQGLERPSMTDQEARAWLNLF